VGYCYLGNKKGEKREIAISVQTREKNGEKIVLGGRSGGAGFRNRGPDKSHQIGVSSLCEQGTIEKRTLQVKTAKDHTAKM